VAVAAAEVLGRLYPVAAEGLATKARAVGETCVAGAFATAEDVEAGRQLGHAVAAGVIARPDAEGDGRGPTRYPEPDPELPAAGAWPPWLARVPDPALPPADPRPELAAVLARSQHLDIRARNLADRWLSQDPAVHWSERASGLVAEAGLDFPHAQRVMAIVAAAGADAASASWRLAYQVNRVRPRALAPTLETIRFAPAHPAWPDDGAAIAAAASEVLAAAFPAHAAELRQEAADAAEAGFDGGQHYRRDGVDGRALGTAVGRAAVGRLPR